MRDNITTLVWLDVETTGLRPNTDELLQVACIVTDLLGNEVAEPFEVLVAHDNVDQLIEQSDPFVQTMHATTGLWDRLRAGEGAPLADVDAALFDYIASVAPEPLQAQFAGNSVRFDMNWAERCLPKTYAHLHYRNIDVTALMSTLERFGAVDCAQCPEFVGDKHNAADDIRHAVRCYRWLNEELHHE